MTTQYQIRKVFIQDWCRQCDQPGTTAWLIKGDFDHFKLTNDLYGSLISDYLLDWTLEVIEAELKSLQREWQCEEVLWNFVGDDVTIYIPPSTRQEVEIEKLLWKICDAIAKSFFHRYRVAALPFPCGFFEDALPESLERLRTELERMEVVLDFARRQQGYVVLFPAEETGIQYQTVDRVLQITEHCSGKSIPSRELQMEWIYDPDRCTSRTINEGFVQSPSVSFAALSISAGLHSGPVPYDRRSVYERVSLACQSALKACKQQRKQVVLQKDEPVSPANYLAYQPAGALDFSSPLRWSSERYLRETFYFRKLDQPVLFQFNPVYHSTSTLFSSLMADGLLAIEKYRGNRYGIGLKGINEIFGQNAATCLIGELMSAFSKVMQTVLLEKAIPPERVHIARFVDRFTVCCEKPVFQLPDIVDMVQRLTRLFNCASDEIKISHMRTNVVLGETSMIGYRLFHQLALTSLSPQSTIVENSNPPIEVRQNYPASVLQQGSDALERNSSASANLWDFYNGVLA